MKLIFKYYPKLNQLQLNILKDLSFHMTKLYNIANYLCVNQGFKSYRELEKLLKNFGSFKIGIKVSVTLITINNA